MTWEDLKESGVLVDDKEYTYDDEEKEWISPDGDKLTDDELLNKLDPGSDTTDPLPDEGV